MSRSTRPPGHRSLPSKSAWSGEDGFDWLAVDDRGDLLEMVEETHLRQGSAVTRTERIGTPLALDSLRF
jgi:hypothetical protein